MTVSIWLCLFGLMIVPGTVLIAEPTSSACLPKKDHQVATITDYSRAAETIKDFAHKGSALRLYPYNMHLTAGATSSEPLVVIDRSGTVQSGTVVFFNYDASLISIDSLGYVHALRVETDAEIGTWVNAQLDGEFIDNSCVVRVLSQDYGFSFTEVIGNHTILWYPVSINGEDIQSQVDQFQIPLVDEYAYDLEAEYMGLFPFDSCRQIIALDFGESETQRVCGISGNPFRLGWNINGNEWQNCLLVPFLPPRSPQWFVIYHELAHNFTWPSYTFGYGLGYLWQYSEGIASALAIEVMQNIRTQNVRFPINTPADTSLAFVIDMQRWNFEHNFQNWLDNGAAFGDFNPDIVDGIWLKYRDSVGISFTRRFFLALQPRFVSEMMPFLDSLAVYDSVAARHTLFAALVGAACKQNLADVFENDYNYPLVHPFHDYVYAASLDIMNREEVVCGDIDMTTEVNISDVVYLVCYIFSGCAAPPLSATDVDCDGAITISDAVYMIEYIFSYGALPCAACK
jgi:hypothetical protein